VGTVTIAGSAYSIYGEHAGADSALVYLTGSFSAAASAWLALLADDQRRTLVAATRWLDSKDWQGAKTVSSQALEWPRTGATYADGSAVPSATVPPEIRDACYELAAQLAIDRDAQERTGGSPIRSMSAGGVEYELFRPAEAGGAAGEFPPRVLALVSQLMATQPGDATGSRATGTGSSSAFEDEDELDLVEGGY
jgi:hypothetical protein